LFAIGKPDGRHEVWHGIAIEKVSDQRAELHTRTRTGCNPCLGRPVPVRFVVRQPCAGAHDLLKASRVECTAAGFRSEHCRGRADSEYQPPVRAQGARKANRRLANEIVEPAFRMPPAMTRGHSVGPCDSSERVSAGKTGTGVHESQTTPALQRP